MLCTTTFSKSDLVTELAAQPARRTDDRPTATAGMLGTILDAFLEGLAAQRRYEHLRSKRIHHDAALRRAFGISPPASA